MSKVLEDTRDALLVLEDGTQFSGFSVAAKGITVGEMVFNTATTGYQEIITDPSYAKQLITFTYPHIGNTGITHDDNESSCVQASGLIMRDISKISSNFRSISTLPDYLKAQNVIAISGIDCRKLTILLRTQGSMKACLMAGALDYDQALMKANEFTGLKGLNLTQQVTTKKIYTLDLSMLKQSDIDPLGYITDFQQSKTPLYHVVVYDFGVKKNILHKLVLRGCRVTVVPADTSAEVVLAMKPSGIFLSNGPGDPAASQDTIQTIRTFLDLKIPLLGICLGYQLLGLACGAKTIKMKYGHHGSNHPVQDMVTRKVLITSQNHSFVVDDHALPDCFNVTHRSLFDNTLQGLSHKTLPAFGFQGHPEASPGPHDADLLFDEFITLLKKL